MPLSDEAVAVLQDVPVIDGRKRIVFTTTGETPISGYSRAEGRLDAAVARVLGREPERWTYHDLRRTVASGMARLGIPLPVIQKVLNHGGGSFAGIVGVYQRHSFADEKRRALEAWGRHVAGLLEGRSETNVIQLRG